MSQLLIYPLPALVPRKLRTEIIARTKELRARLPQLNEGVDFLLPDIALIQASLQLSADTLVFARTSYRLVHEQGEMVIHLPAPTLAACGSAELVEAIIAHEFLHVVHETLRIYNHSSEQKDGVRASIPPDDSPEYLRTWEEYTQIDSRLQASPELWLSSRLADLTTRFDSDESEHERLAHWTVNNWIRKGYPIVQQDPDYRFPGWLSLDERIIAKARRLNLVS